MPKPKPYEREKEYIKRCMSDSEMKSKHSDYNERYAVCKSFFVEYETDEYQNKNFWNEDRKN